jgi:hypothetical protein
MATCFAHSPDSQTQREQAALASVRARKRRAEERGEALDKAALGVRGALAAELQAQWAEVVRILVTDAIAAGDAKLLLASLTQAFGAPAQTLQVEETQTEDAELRAALDRWRAQPGSV